MSTEPANEGGKSLVSGFLVVVSGPSAVGKNTLVSATLRKVPGLRYSVSATTRPPRPGERDGVHYFFLSDEVFSKWVADGEFLEWAEYCGHRYGTPKRHVERDMAAGKIVILDIDVQGARQIRAQLSDGVFVFLLPPSWQELKKRIEKRGTESPAAVEARLRLAAEEARAIDQYDYCILNDDPRRAARELEAILLAERCRVRRFSHGTWLEQFLDDASAK